MRTFVKKIRNEKGLGINKLCIMAGVGTASIVGLEKEDKDFDPQVGTLIKIADALNVELIELVNFDAYRNVVKK
jgi:transcriptional regulator with XRE-family HTH domain